jgi:SnoaL-like protein
MDAAALADREAIRDVIGRYAHAADSGRFEDLAALFDVDGVLEVDGGLRSVGRAAILEFVSGVRDRSSSGGVPQYVRHHTTNTVIDLTGVDSAEAASYFLVFSDVGADHWGRYRDRLVRTAGGWRFAHRRVRTDGYGVGSHFVDVLS